MALPPVERSHNKSYKTCDVLEYYEGTEFLSTANSLQMLD